jgi:uncharacterized protein
MRSNEEDETVFGARALEQKMNVINHATPQLELADWRRRVFELYASIRHNERPHEAWQDWCSARDQLFRHHPQSPLDDDGRAAFAGLRYYRYSPDWRVVAEAVAVPETSIEIETSTDHRFAAIHFADARFALAGEDCSLPLYWLSGYGGGVLLSVADATSGATTYGGGRYLLDTIKGADLGESDGRLVLDFNFSYNPSCAYNPRWTCPLASPASRLAIAVEAGERSR